MQTKKGLVPDADIILALVHWLWERGPETHQCILQSLRLRQELPKLWARGWKVWAKVITAVLFAAESRGEVTHEGGGQAGDPHVWSCDENQWMLALERYYIEPDIGSAKRPPRGAQAPETAIPEGTGADAETQPSGDWRTREVDPRTGLVAMTDAERAPIDRDVDAWPADDWRFPESDRAAAWFAALEAAPPNRHGRSARSYLPGLVAVPWRWLADARAEGLVSVRSRQGTGVPWLFPPTPEDTAAAKAELERRWV